MNNFKNLAVIAAAAFMSGCASRYVDVPDDTCYCAPTDKNGQYQNFAIIEEASGDTIYNVKTDGYAVSGQIKDGEVIRDTVFVGLPTKLTPEDNPDEPNSRVHFSLNQKDQLCRKFKFGGPDDLNSKRIYFTKYELKNSISPSSP